MNNTPFSKMRIIHGDNCKVLTVNPPREENVTKYKPGEVISVPQGTSFSLKNNTDSVVEILVLPPRDNRVTDPEYFARKICDELCERENEFKIFGKLITHENCVIPMFIENWVWRMGRTENPVESMLETFRGLILDDLQAEFSDDFEFNIIEKLITKGVHTERCTE